MLGGLDGCLLNNSFDHYVGWLEEATRCLNKKAFEDLMVVLWNIWNNSNNFIHRGKEDELKVVWERAKALSDDFQIFNFINPPMLPKVLEKFSWDKPSRDVIKINVDAALDEDSTGIGIIARDWEGSVIGERCTTGKFGCLRNGLNWRPSSAGFYGTAKTMFHKL